MIDIALVRDNPEKVKQAVVAKNCRPELVDSLLAVDTKWRATQSELDTLRQQQKQHAAARDIEAGKKLKETVRSKEQELAELEKEREQVWLRLPNLPSEDTPLGQDDSQNVVVRKWGEPTKFDFEPKDHMALGTVLDIVDTETAAKVSGTRFGYIKGGAAMMQYALILYAHQILQDEKVLRQAADKVAPDYSAKPFYPVVPPVMIRPEVFRRMARLDASTEEERYYLPKDDLYLVGSAEHTLGPMHMDETLSEEQLPLRYVGYSTAFRREAGSYGQDTKGILRVHQFDKVEMESFVAPEDGQKEQEFFVALQEYIMQQLKLPYQVVICCTGDQGDPDARHLDIETWMPGQNRYRETHSADYMTDYQSRRLKTRVKRQDGKLELVHMNDATVVAIGRTLIAILENYQTVDGHVRVPEVLQKYIGREVI